MMKFPWTKRFDEAKAQTQKAETEYRWAVMQRTTVSRLVERVLVQGEENNVIEKFRLVTRGGSS